MDGEKIMIESVYFCVLLTLAAYQIGLVLKNKVGINALLVAIVLVMIIISTLHIEVVDYQENTKYISYLLTPATICLAIPLYEQFHLFKQNYKAVLVGIFTGVIISLISITCLSLIFKLSYQELVSLLPKSITTAIGMGVSEELGGIVSITVASIIMTGVLGAVIAPSVLKLFNIKNPIAKGIGIGTAAHAIGTSKAMEIGEVEGAMSSLSIVIAGLITVILAPIIVGLL